MKALQTMILAAGKGTRMRSELPKVLHEICGVSLLDNVLDTIAPLTSTTPIVVIGHGRELVVTSVGNRAVDFAVQEEMLGTGHAVMMGRSFIDPEADVMILNGDVPLLTTQTLEAFWAHHRREGASGTVMTMRLADPTGYGRIVKDEGGHFSEIIEEKDADTQIRTIDEVNGGIYLFRGADLLKALDGLTNENAQGEYYLTDVLGILRSKARVITTFSVDPQELIGVNSRVQLAEAEEVLQGRILEDLMASGVTIRRPGTVYIDKRVRVGRDTIIWPGTVLRGETVIGEGCEIGPDADITDCRIADDVSIKSSTLIESSVDSGTKVGPYAYLRPNSRVGKDAKVGDFVELKNANIGDGTKISHLTYVGDGDVGDRVNIGCGVVFVNYDGKNKHRTTVGDDAFIGCNVNLVSPVRVGEGGYVAAGSTITEDVAPGALAIARSRQEEKQGWVAKKGLLKK